MTLESETNSSEIYIFALFANSTPESLKRNEEQK